MEEKIKLLVVDDHAVVRTGLSTWIATESDLELIGEAADGLEAVAKALELKPDVILMDLIMPKKDGIEAIVDILREDPNARILAVTSFPEKDKSIPAIKAGALGFITKDASPEEMQQAIRTVHQGMPWLSPDITRMLMHDNLLKQSSLPLDDPLTKRELEVLKLIAQGLSDADIANILVISKSTVNFHVTNILSKLQVKNRTQATLYAIKEGFITL